jgi:hypothetical protein
VATVSVHKKKRYQPGDLILSKGSMTFVGMVVEYKPPKEGFSYAGDKGCYLILTNKKDTKNPCWIPAETIHKLT